MVQDVNNRAAELQADPSRLLEGELMPAPGEPPLEMPKRIGDYLPDAFAAFANRNKTGARVPWPAGWDSLSAKFDGGLLAGLHILVGGTGSGKTQLALQMAKSAAEKAPVLFLALEADAGFGDLIARLADMSGHKEAVNGWSGIYKGKATVTQLEAIRAAANHTLANLPLYPVRMDPSFATADRIRAQADSFRENLATDRDRPALLVLDYIQRVKGRSVFGEQDTRAAIGGLSSALRKVATELNLAVLALSSTARDHYGTLLVELDGDGAGLKKGGEVQGKQQSNKQTPRAFMPGTYSPARLVGLGKEAGEIEFDADSVLAIVRGQVGAWTPGGKSKHWIAIAKQRAGGEGWVEMDFNGHRWAEVRSGAESGNDADENY